METVALIAIEEPWMLPDLTSALNALPLDLRDESLAFNEMGDHQQRLEDLGAGRLATMDAHGIDISIIALWFTRSGARRDRVRVPRRLRKLRSGGRRGRARRDRLR